VAVIVRPTPSPAPYPAVVGSFLRARRLVQRNLLVYRHSWMVVFSGFFEPLFYLLGIGYGLGTIVAPQASINDRRNGFCSYEIRTM